MKSSLADACATLGWAVAFSMRTKAFLLVCLALLMIIAVVLSAAAAETTALNVPRMRGAAARPGITTLPPSDPTLPKFDAVDDLGLLMTSRCPLNHNTSVNGFAKEVVEIMRNLERQNFETHNDPHHASYKRRFHVFGLGWAKSGTTSLARLLGAQPMAQSPGVLPHVQHEPAIASLALMIFAYEARKALLAAGEEVPHTVKATFVRELLERERWMGRLEADVSFLNAPIAPLLARLYPDAKFVVSLRDPISHTGSMTRYFQAMSSGAMGVVWQRSWHMLGKSLHAGFFGPMPTLNTVPGEEKQMKTRFPESWTIEQMLVLWCDHLTSLLSALPPPRLLFLRTHELHTSDAAAKLGAFLHVPPSSFPFHRANAYQTVATEDPLELLPAGYFDTVLQRVLGRDPTCSAAKRRFFPEPKFNSFAQWKEAREKKKEAHRSFFIQ